MALDGLYKIILKNKHAIRQKAEDRIDSLVLEYIPTGVEDASCPAPADLQRILAIREQVRQPLLTLNKKVEPLNNFLTKIPPILSAIKITIGIFKALPIPNQFTTAGLVLTLGDRLADLKKLVEDFEDEVRNGTAVVAGVNKTTQDILTKLTEIDALIEKCAGDAIEQDPEFAALVDTQLKQTDENPLEEEYKGYQIKIEEEKVGKLTQRFAVAINSKGERSVIGNKSFSATTKVLLDEAKFEVDKLLQ
jgi:hypothetical protein